MEKGPILFKYRPRPSLNVDAGPSNADDTYNFRFGGSLIPFYFLTSERMMSVANYENLY